MTAIRLILPLVSRALSRAPTPGEGDTARAMDRVIGRVGDLLRYVARKIARGDRARADELYQEALIRLWELDAARFEAHEIGFVTRALVNRMLDVARVFQREQSLYLSLDAELPLAWM